MAIVSWFLFGVVCCTGFLLDSSIAQDRAGKGAGLTSTIATNLTGAATAAAPSRATPAVTPAPTPVHKDSSAPISDLNFKMDTMKVMRDRLLIERARAFYINRSNALGYRHRHDCSKYIPKKLYELLQNESGAEADEARGIFNKSR